MVYFARATLRFDGACQPNPGEGGAGYEIFNSKNGRTIIQGRHYIGYDCTNNVAEYFGLIEGLKHLRRSPHVIGHLDIEGDSELVINQMKGIYRVNSHRLRPLYKRAKELISKCHEREFDSYDFDHIDREDNSYADSLANDAIQYEDDWSVDNY
jgi:ribonuclease HI